MKKVLAVLLALVTAFSLCTVSAGAQETAGTITRHTLNGENVPMERGVQPRFQYLRSISSRMSRDGGISVSTGFASVYAEYDNTLSITVQRKVRGVWKDLRTWSKSAPGEEILTLEREYALTKGYDYRAVTTVLIDTGTDIEIVDCTSTTVYY